MSLDTFLTKVKSGQAVAFDETMAVIAEYYDYRPTEFNNGSGDDIAVNAAGSNEGSCKIFAFALLQRLNEEQTLNLFGAYYRDDVLNDPDGTGHRNIRNFMRYGWQGIRFEDSALIPK
ncbi:MAG: HopJ type III effector protein [Gammaproteobacteria bacterium]